MAVFGKYSRYYDLLYQEKDYKGEAEYIAGLIEKFKPGTRNYLELGSGSGIHASLLSKMGYSAEGYDFSEEMLNAAQARRELLPPEQAERLNFTRGDIRNLRLGKKFDCVTALFHVLSYTASNVDLKAAFTTVREHMNPGAVFIFDSWYGPSVLTIRPSVRIKRVRNELWEITRIAEPVLNMNECYVDVNYTMFVRDLASDEVEQLQETHRMRYLFKPEVELLAESSGMRLEHTCNWMSDDEPDATTWGVCFVLRAI